MKTIIVKPANRKAREKLAPRLRLRPSQMAATALLAGVTCPGAEGCLAWVKQTPNGLRIVDGKKARFRCYAASLEAGFRSVWEAHQRATDATKALLAIGGPWLLAEQMAADLSALGDIRAVRLSESGDLIAEAHYQALALVARARPDVVFYGYSKTLWPFLDDSPPENLRFTYSWDGRFDQEAKALGAPIAYVVDTYAEAAALGVPVDTDDTHAYYQDGNTGFALVLHGTQPAARETKTRKLEVIQ